MKTKKNFTSQRGMSIVEILIAIAIFAVIFTAALMIYDRSNRVFKSGVESSEMQQNTRVAFDKLVSDIRMAGFDYDRDGLPSGAKIVGGVTHNQQQQPDEQLEYAGRHAIVIRGNFDYETETDPALTDNGQNGREGAYEPPNGEFPVVTTGNDEIVAYVLKSDKDPVSGETLNADTLTFYADVSKPRNVYINPDDTAQVERQVTIPNIELTTTHPPYTLYRVTLSDDNNATPGLTPIANNIRDLTLTYYQDAAGVTPVTDLANAAINQDTIGTTVGGLGQYNPKDPVSSVTPRGIRSKIQSIRMVLIGMNSAEDRAYVNPAETLAAAQHFRQYRLESLITPRNFSKRGMREQEFKEPGAPALTDVCFGWCGTAYLTWDAPAPDPTKGSPESYVILYGTTTPPTLTFDAGLQLSGRPYDMFDPSQNYYFAVKAVNSYGSATSNIMGPLNIRNNTTPSAPTALIASGGGGGAPTPVPNVINLAWQRPTTNISGAPSCQNGGTPPGGIPVEEIKGWRVERRPTSGGSFAPIWDENMTGTNAPQVNPITGLVTFTDANVANCTDYIYRVREVEGATHGSCLAAAYNNGSYIGLSDWSNVTTGHAESTTAPAAPSSLISEGTSHQDTSINKDVIDLAWRAVTKDLNNANIVITEYQITELRKKDGDPTSVPSPDSPIIVTPPSNCEGSTHTLGCWMPTDSPNNIFYQRVVDKTDLSDGRDWIYTYEVRAAQCTTLGTPLSGPSPQVVYPCDLGAIDFSTGVSVVSDGSGTAGDPWLTSYPANVDIGVTGGTADVIIATLNGAEIGRTTTPGTSASFPLPDIPDGVISELDVTIKVGLCSRTKPYFVTQAVNNCCLVPMADRSGGVVDNTVMTWDGPSGDVFIFFKNICTDTLTISSVDVAWNRSRVTGSGSKRVDYVEWPTAAGGRTNENISDNTDGAFTAAPNLASPAGSAIILGPSNTYRIRIHFTSTFTLPPVTKICVHYSGSLGNDSCQIVPFPSLTDNQCDP